MIRILIAALLLAAPAHAACTGTDRFTTEMSESQRAGLAARAHAVPHATGLMFRAQKGAQEITLVGTYHLPDPRHAGLVAASAPALRGARVLLVEAGPEEEAALQHGIASDMSLMFNASGPTLPELLPEAQWQELAALAAARGTPAFLAAKMKPAFLAITLSIPPCATAQLAQGQGGLDKLLIAEAAAAGVPVRALEPWDTAFRLFDTLPEADALALLRNAMAEAARGDDNAVTSANLYFAGEPRLLWEASAQWARDSGMPEAEVAREMALAEDLLMDRRNHAWLPRILEAAGQGPVLVAVGALHLPGQGGLLALLEDAGFTVTRLDRTE
jgi:uncharacterized protein YbaP (TraB family)